MPRSPVQGGQVVILRNDAVPSTVLPFTVPAQSGPTANDVIDPTGAQDSTAGLQTYIDSTPSGTTIYLGFDLQINGQITLQDGRTLHSVDINNPSKLYRTLTHPYRIVPDLRSNQPSYNQHGKCAKWLYDKQGGKAFEPRSIGNPSWNGYTYLNNTPDGVVNNVAGDGVVNNGSNIITTASYTFTAGDIDNIIQAVCPTTDVGGSASSILPGNARIASIINAHTATLDDGSGHAVNYSAYPSKTNVTFRFNNGSGSSGGDNGGYCATDENHLGNWDGLHIKALGGETPWNISDIGRVVTPFQNTGTDSKFNRIISAVKLDGVDVTGFTPGNSVHWDVSQGVAPSKQNGTHTMNWCVVDQPGTGGWIVEFQPNPTWQPFYFSGSGYSNMSNAYAKLTDVNQNPVVAVMDSSTLHSSEIVGANDGARNTVLSFKISAPLITEFARAVTTETTSSRVILSNIHNSWGSAEVGPGQLLFTRLTSTGMQGCTAHFDGKHVIACTFDDNRHTPIDIEGSVTSTTYAFGPNGDGTAHTPLYEYTPPTPNRFPLNDSIGAIYTPTTREAAWLADPANAFLYTQFPINNVINGRRFAVLNIPNHNEDVVLSDNIIGAKAFVALSSSVWGLSLLRNRSLTSDVTNGSISSLGTGILAATPNNLGGIGLDHVIDSNTFDKDVPNTGTLKVAAIWVANVDRIQITNNRHHCYGYFIWGSMKDGTLHCTNMAIADNDIGTSSQGVIAPAGPIS